MAEMGISALEEFIGEIGLPRSLREMGIKEEKMLKEIADSCHYSPGSCRRPEPEEILEIFRECYSASGTAC